MESNSGSIHARLQQWSSWPVAEKPVLEKILAGGLNHQVYLLRCGANLFVLKEFSQPNQLAVELQNAVASHQLSPKILYHDADYNYCLMEWFEPTSIFTSQVDPPRLRQLARSLAALHSLSLPIKLSQFDFEAHAQRYLTELPSAYHQAHQHLASAISSFDFSTECRVVCHNDLVQENILFTAQSVRFIDWEYGQLNSPWFDLAAVSFYFDLTPKQIALLLEYYRNNVTQLQPYDSNSDPMRTAMLEVIWLDSLWRAARHQFDRRRQEHNCRRINLLLKEIGFEPMPKLASDA